MPNYLPSDIGTGWTVGAGWASVETSMSVLRLMASPGEGVAVLKVSLSSVVGGVGNVDPSRGDPAFRPKVAGLRSSSLARPRMGTVVGRWTDGWAGDGVVPGSAFVEVAFMVELKLSSVVALVKAAQMAINIQSTKHS